MEIQYRFTVTATNACGKGNASKSSNVLYIESPLPNGWFRTKSAPAKGQATKGSSSSDPFNPLTSMSSFNFVYYNLHTGQAMTTRPDSDPSFIENLAVLQLFDPREMRALRAIYDEEILHFDKVTKDRLGYILLEVGERVHPNRIRSVVGELCATEHHLDTFPEFMDVMYTFKKRSIAMR